MMTAMWLMVGGATSALLLGRSGKLANLKDLENFGPLACSVAIARADVAAQEEAREALEVARTDSEGAGHVLHAAGLQV